MKNIAMILLLCSIVLSRGIVDVLIDKKELIKGESLTLTIVSQNTNDFPKIELPSLSDFKIIGGPNQSSSSSIKIINGVRKDVSSTSISWSLLPLKIGENTKFNLIKKIL